MLDYCENETEMMLRDNSHLSYLSFSLSEFGQASTVK